MEPIYPAALALEILQFTCFTYLMSKINLTESKQMHFIFFVLITTLNVGIT